MKKGKNITMREAKQKTGLSSRQIRYYDEQDLIFPARSSGNQRLFSVSDIKRLVKIKELLAAGNSIETIRSKLSAPALEQNIEDDVDFDDNYDYYSDVDLDSLYPVSNRSELMKKLSRSNKEYSKEEEE
ncbi:MULTISPECIES: MerR family transcriptional regulator [Halanaerobium]|jgi:MerR family glutamine synthetase transcriptional repressor|uniref:MerR family transcriptional regulator, glutamine synthetase repressor n=1 Tax=Halanaerobium kushneri TaxID=56779 RepID=A0A1N7ASH1_9FIRM|nr:MULTISPECIES: MerR family transcriptional regulator [Halanaerobium]RCW54673.1 MerR family glutamine synthetase transcriptional repressor [Halanaerobium sp. ST460_2HS_T2]SIR41962.1 MerR family transcriptional regulator, glutamine synthetase repressor [Halanaerobium kushneri]